MRIRHRAREVRIYTREREQRISTSSTRVESTFSTCDSSSVSRIHCEDNYLGRSSYHHQQRTRESLFITRTNKPRITTVKIFIYVFSCFALILLLIQAFPTFAPTCAYNYCSYFLELK
ncbi:hypothetical protein Tsp_10359 [Trichinella spiralis]|uniref:hypothetical protein n=1 Tax=Trichinella spiralis TaxID=6334 RepID=UPI0001EFE8D5|nr:hypothetical protein Tsp_10359 [Trichinella spiralis]